MYICISDQAFPHKCMHINIQSKVTGWAHPGLLHCAVIQHRCTSTKLCAKCAPDYSSPSSGPTAQDLSPRNIHTFFLATENSPCKASHYFLPKRIFDLCFDCLFATQNKYNLLFTCIHMTMLKHFTFQKENTFIIISYF